MSMRAIQKLHVVITQLYINDHKNNNHHGRSCTIQFINDDLTQTRAEDSFQSGILSVSHNIFPV